MQEYRVVSVDMFQTLVDLDSRREQVWQRILGDQYTKEREAAYAKLLSAHVIDRFHRQESGSATFRNLRTFFVDGFESMLREEVVPFDPRRAAGIFTEEHGQALSFADSEDFIKNLGRDYPVCLVSDADREMIEPLLRRFSFDAVFISEDYRSYKQDPESKIFKRMLQHYQASPAEVLHVGDSSSDVLGARRVGIDVCWLNRNRATWKYAVNPTYEVADLSGVFNVLKAGRANAGKAHVS